MLLFLVLLSKHDKFHSLGFIYNECNLQKNKTNAMYCFVWLYYGEDIQWAIMSSRILGGKPQNCFCVWGEGLDWRCWKKKGHHKKQQAQRSHGMDYQEWLFAYLCNHEVSFTFYAVCKYQFIKNGFSFYKMLKIISSPCTKQRKSVCGSHQNNISFPLNCQVIQLLMTNWEIKSLNI